MCRPIGQLVKTNFRKNNRRGLNMIRWRSAAGAACAAVAMGSVSIPQTRRTAVTFTKDVAPIVFSACAPCHHPGGAAPFPLLTYQDVSAHAAQIPTDKRAQLEPTINQLLRAAWLLDAFGDLGNREQITAAYADFRSAVAGIEALARETR